MHFTQQFAQSTSRLRSWLAPCAVLLVGAPIHAQSIPAGVDTKPREISLAEARRLAESNRPQLRIAAAVADRARGAARVAHVIPNPTVAAQFDERTPTRQTTVSQPLSWIVRRGADIATGNAITARGVADSAQLMADIGRDVQRSFFGALAARQRLDIATEQLRFADSLVTLADRRVTAGDLSELERDQIAQEAARVRIAHAQARELSRTAAVALARSVGNEAQELSAAGDLGEGLNRAPVLPAPVNSANVAEMFAVRAIVADSLAAAARFRAARLSQIPLPALVAGLEWGTVSTGTSFDARRTPIIGFSLALPLWSQGREVAAEARGAAMEAAARASESRLTSGAQLAAAHIRVAETSARARYARDSVYTQAVSIRERAVRLYDAGRTGLLPVLDALRVERDLAAIVIQELLAFQEARADLIALTGNQP